MIKRIVSTIAAALATASMAAEYTIIADSQTPNKATPIDSLFVGDTGTVKVVFYQNNVLRPVTTGETAKFWYGTNGLASSAIHSITATSTNLIEFDSADFPAASPGIPGYWTYGVNIGEKVYGIGKLYVRSNPSSGDPSDLDLREDIDWGMVARYMGGLTGPYRAGSNVTGTTNADGSVTFSVDGVQVDDWQSGWGDTNSWNSAARLLTLHSNQTTTAHGGIATTSQGVKADHAEMRLVARSNVWDQAAVDGAHAEMRLAARSNAWDTASTLSGTALQPASTNNFDARYVNTSGDTMTGTLNFNDGLMARFGTGQDASITFDGDSLNIVANAVTSTDDLEFTTDRATFTTGLNGLTISGGSTAITRVPTSKGMIGQLYLNNLYYDADNDGTGSAMYFSTRPLNSASPYSTAAILAANETDWDAGTQSTMDSYLAIQTRLDGVLTEKMRLTSAGNLWLPVDGQKIQLGDAYDSALYFGGADTIMDLASAGVGGLIFQKSPTAKTASAFQTFRDSATIAADNDGTAARLRWQFVSGAPTYNINDAAYLDVLSESDWSSTASTRDAAMVFYTTLDGTTAEKMRLSSGGLLTVTGSTTTDGIAGTGKLTVTGVNGTTGVGSAITITGGVGGLTGTTGQGGGAITMTSGSGYAPVAGTLTSAGSGGSAQLLAGEGGGNVSGAGTGGTTTGGAGGPITVKSGRGGSSNKAGNINTGGAGGNANFGTSGGGSASTANTSKNTGGAGGAVYFTAGLGGDAMNGTPSEGGVGGAMYIYSGAGGIGDGGVGKAGTAGASGTVQLYTAGGTGLYSGGTVIVGGASGSLGISTGNGGSANGGTVSNTGGAAGHLSIGAGIGGPGYGTNPTAGANGHIVFYSGSTEIGRWDNTAGSVGYLRLPIDGQRFQLGAAQDAYIAFDGNSMNIVANAVTAADAMEFTAGSYKLGVPADTDIAVTFTGTSNSGLLTWMEDEDYFKSSDDILMNSTEKVYFRDSAISISSVNDGSMTIAADASVRLDSPITYAKAILPISENTYYLGNPSDAAPICWKGIMLHDQTNGKHWKLTMVGGVLTTTEVLEP